MHSSTSAYIGTQLSSSTYLCTTWGSRYVWNLVIINMIIREGHPQESLATYKRETPELLSPHLFCCVVRFPLPLLLPLPLPSHSQSLSHFSFGLPIQVFITSVSLAFMCLGSVSREGAPVVGSRMSRTCPVRGLYVPSIFWMYFLLCCLRIAGRVFVLLL